MTIDLYYMPESPPCRAVQMVAAHLNIHLNLKNLDLSKGEHYTDQEFVKLNPQHIVPTIVDNGLVLCERYYQKFALIMPIIKSSILNANRMSVSI